jgi:hypothetical protein
MSRYHSTMAGPFTFVANTSKTILRASPSRCRLILPIPSGTSIEFNFQETTVAGQGFFYAGLTYPLILMEEIWGDLVERAFSCILSNAITINVWEVFDTERKP